LTPASFFRFTFEGFLFLFLDPPRCLISFLSASFQSVSVVPSSFALTLPPCGTSSSYPRGITSHSIHVPVTRDFSFALSLFHQKNTFVFFSEPPPPSNFGFKRYPPCLPRTFFLFTLSWWSLSHDPTKLLGSVSASALSRPSSPILTSGFYLNPLIGRRLSMGPPPYLAHMSRNFFPQVSVCYFFAFFFILRLLSPDSSYDGSIF